MGGERFDEWESANDLLGALKREEALARKVAREVKAATGIDVDWRVLSGRVRVTPERDKSVMARWPLPTVAKELYAALHRIALVEPLDLQVTTGTVSLEGPASFAALELQLHDVDERDAIRPAALERVRDWASGLAHRINEHSPSGVLWGVSLVLESRPLAYTATLYVQWSIVPVESHRLRSRG